MASMGQGVACARLSGPPTCQVCLCLGISADGVSAVFPTGGLALGPRAERAPQSLSSPMPAQQTPPLPTCGASAEPAFLQSLLAPGALPASVPSYWLQGDGTCLRVPYLSGACCATLWARAASPSPSVLCPFPHGHALSPTARPYFSWDQPILRRKHFRRLQNRGPPPTKLELFTCRLHSESFI